MNHLRHQNYKNKYTDMKYLNNRQKQSSEFLEQSFRIRKRF